MKSDKIALNQRVIFYTPNRTSSLLIYFLYMEFLLLENINWSLVLIIFVAYIIVDGLYVTYTLAVTNLKPIKAANVSSITYLILAIGVISYVENFLYVIPMALGSWVGTYFVVSRRKNNKSKKKHH